MTTTTNAIQKLRDFYDMKPNAPLVQEEFGFLSLDRWKREGHIKDGDNLADLFGYDPSGKHDLWQLGWCEASFEPGFTVEVLEDRGAYELVRDIAGRHVLYFKNRRNGFMPEYVDHPVKDEATWANDVKWRLDPSTRARYADLEARMAKAKAAAAQGAIISQRLVGGYMYLRSLVGPEEILYLFYDAPELVHDMMRTWLALADAVTTKHQAHVALDELFLAEDICYNGGSLISPEMMREFLLPYYQELIQNVKRRQPADHHLFLQIDTDGACHNVIPLYQELGMDVMSPFEVASGCDVIALRKQYPELRMRGGFDKRILAAGKDAIDREIERIMPFMKAHGGYIPTSDHDVPEEVSFEDYMYYREKMRAF